MSAESDAGGEIGAGGLFGFQVTGEIKSERAEAPVDEVHLRHAVDAQEQVDREIEIDPLAPLMLAEVDRVVADVDRRRPARLVPVNRDRQANVLARFELGG